MASKKTGIKVGPVTVDVRAAVAAVLVVAVLGGGGFVYYQMKMKAAQEAAAQAAAEGPAKRVYDAAGIAGGSYYIKDGDSFYPVVPGALYSDLDDDTAIASKADPDNRILMFGNDDGNIPTLYTDGALVFKAKDGESIPQEFVLERFYDNGWSVGARGLTQLAGGNLQTEVSDMTFYPGSSISDIKAASGSELIFDKIDGLPFGEDILSSVGTINGLTKGQSYQLDAYVGTDYVGLTATADTHILISMERYAISDYSLDPAGYLSVTIPRDLWSGYYYINGAGCFLYINQPKSMGDTVTDLNTAYYIVDEAGNETVNPAEGYGESTDSDRTWDTEFPVAAGTNLLSAEVSFSGSLASGTPEAKLISPNGGEYVLSIPEGSESVLSGEAELPQEGTWVLSVSGMSGRVFDVSLSFGTEDNGIAAMIRKTDETQAEAEVELPDLLDAVLTFTWDNTEYAGTFLVVGPGGEAYGNTETPDLVESESYGKVSIRPGSLAAGNYKIYVTGKALGNVSFSYEETGTEIAVEGESADEQVQE